MRGIPGPLSGDLDPQRPRDTAAPALLMDRAR